MNNRVKELSTEILSDNWSILKKAIYQYQQNDGRWQTHVREAYDRGNGVAMLLYNKEQGTVILTRQFRLPTYVNGNEDGMLIEVCAGKLDSNNPEECAKREVEEETGFKITHIQKVMEAYTSPGSVTEMLYLFVAEYNAGMKVHAGGGVAHEQEEIEVLEVTLEQAMEMIVTGEIKDAKTIMLLQYAKLNQLMG
ncbi:nudix-type nucleoside diphosphatase, YffH/AdpP family [Filimonas lacunae]|uniref:GDP-mannose pyrophosphatase n=1 Tax=Filimonas lacunae TaxID=477680 RepID=A0A173MR68_9BACT|nr:NUDIX domain-containing protein [Filimonas lacunae]BAV09940.1 GDP-mannose pyrophosphatase YffH [Filimonas lacunae]SIS81429.1 nudix-type nucleoside diphosphatase, YffH/AdpP family [Filimonas lacunae]